MKKIILLYFVLFAFSVVVNAQLIKSISVSGGYTNSFSKENKFLYSQHEFDNIIDKPNYNWGGEIGLTYLQKKIISLSLNMGIINKGAETTYIRDYSKIPGNPRCFCVPTDYIIQRDFSYVYLSPRLSLSKKLRKYITYFYASPRFDILVASSQITTIRPLFGFPTKTIKEQQIESSKRFLINGTWGLGIKRELNSKFSLGAEFSNFLDFERVYKVDHNTSLSFNTYAAYLTLQYSLVN